MRMVEEDKVFFDCVLCRRTFQFGRHVYNGRYIRSWDIPICDTCLQGNHDGIILQDHPQLEEHLRAKGVQITLNAKGWLNIP